MRFSIKCFNCRSSNCVVRERLHAFGYAPVSYGPEEYDKLLRELLVRADRLID